MGKINLKDTVFIVEGKSDISKLENIFDADFIDVNGSAISRETIEFIIKLSKSKKIIVLTDPDYPGEKIRRTINDNISGCYNAFVCKDKSIKHHKVGVAECEVNEIIRAVNSVIKFNVDTLTKGMINMHTLYELQLTGCDDSKSLRDGVCKAFGFSPCSNKTFLKRINMLNITKKELETVVKNEQK